MAKGVVYGQGNSAKVTSGNVIIGSVLKGAGLSPNFAMEPSSIPHGIDGMNMYEKDIIGYNGHVYFRDEATPYNMYKMNMSTEEVTNLGPSLSEWQHSVIVGTKLYVGKTDTSHTILDIFDLVSETWSTSATSLNIFDYICAVGTIIYCIAYSGSQIFYPYDTVSDTWLTPLTASGYVMDYPIGIPTLGVSGSIMAEGYIYDLNTETTSTISAKSYMTCPVLINGVVFSMYTSTAYRYVTWDIQTTDTDYDIAPQGYSSQGYASAYFGGDYIYIARLDKRGFNVYNHVTRKWGNYHTSSASTIGSHGVAIGTKLWAMKVVQPYSYDVYDTATDTWSYKSGSASDYPQNPILVGTDIYCDSADHLSLWKYDTLLDQWDETLSTTTLSLGIAKFYSDGKVYVMEEISMKFIGYDIASNTWGTVLNAINPGQSALTRVAQFGNIVWVPEDDNTTNEFHPYYIDSDTYGSQLGLFSSFYGKDIAYGDNCIYMRSAAASYVYYMFDTISLSRYSLGPVDLPGTVFCMASVDGLLYSSTGLHMNIQDVRSYSQINTDLLDGIKTDQYVYCTEDTELVGDGDPSIKVDTWNDTGVNFGDDFMYLAVRQTDIYAKKTGDQLVRYDSDNGNTELGLANPSEDFEHMVFIGDTLYAKQSASPYNVFKYNLSENSWIETTDNPGQSWKYPVNVNGILYALGVSTRRILKYVPETGVWTTEGDIPIGDLAYGVVNGSDIYYKEIAPPYRLVKYDTNRGLLDYTLSQASGQYYYMAIINGVIFTKQSVSPYKVWSYTISNDTWDYSLSSPSENFMEMVSVNYSLYVKATDSPYQFLKYTAYQEGSSVIIPSIYRALTDEDLKAPLNGKLRTKGTTLTKYIGSVTDGPQNLI